MSKLKPVHKSHDMGQEIDRTTPDMPTPKPHMFCKKCLLCNCHDQKYLYKPCAYKDGTYNG